jgi:hypothetical protein
MIKSTVTPRQSTASFLLLGGSSYRRGETASLEFQYLPKKALPPSSRVWLFFDIRQHASRPAGCPQTTDAMAVNYLSATTTNTAAVRCDAYNARTLDLYPKVVEFLFVCEVIFEEGLDEGDAVTIHLGSEPAGWDLPTHPIPSFKFWLVESEPGGWRFEPTHYKSYRVFNRLGDEAAIPETVLTQTIEVTGDPPRPTPENTRRTPGILWGDLHGMAFNQRPLDDYYRYARDEAQYDFAAAMLFSYNVCIDGVWDDVKNTAERWTEPGKFIAITGVEAGTVPNGAHRNAHFFINPEMVPPIFCEDRQPAVDPRFQRRFTKDAVICENLDQYYATVERYQGVVSGHWHTLDYHREILAEIWQKQRGALGEEKRIYELLNKGHILGIVSGSDTHDSMPGNPDPEPGCPYPAGQTGVLASELTHEAIHEAILAHRVYGTTGARIALNFDSNGSPMGSILPIGSARIFEIRAEGSGAIEKIELIRGGESIASTLGDGIAMEVTLEDNLEGCDSNQWYLVKVTQSDGHRAWSSPIWFKAL